MTRFIVVVWTYCYWAIIHSKLEGLASEGRRTTRKYSVNIVEHFGFADRKQQAMLGNTIHVFDHGSVAVR